MNSTHTCEQRISTSGHMESVLCHEVHMFRPFSQGDSGAMTEVTQKLTFVTKSTGTTTRMGKMFFVGLQNVQIKNMKNNYACIRAWNDYQLIWKINVIFFPMKLKCTDETTSCSPKSMEKNPSSPTRNKFRTNLRSCVWQQRMASDQTRRISLPSWSCWWRNWMLPPWEKSLKTLKPHPSAQTTSREPSKYILDCFRLIQEIC